MIEYLDWVVALNVIWAEILIGNKNIKGWYIAVINQILAAIVAVNNGLDGYVVLSFVLAVIFIRNIKKWNDSLPRATRNA